MTSYGDTEICSEKTKTFFARVPTVVQWINENTQGCNQNICSKDKCMTRDKLKPQARLMMQKQTKNRNRKSNQKSIKFAVTLSKLS